MIQATERTVRKELTVAAPIEHAYRVFTDGFGSWWPSTHHIGSAPWQTSIIEARVGGRCYERGTDGSECDWGKVLAWDPPHRLVLAWQLTPEWKYEPDLARASEVEVRFVSLGSDRTRVELEHRAFERQGEGGEAMRQAVAAPNGWPLILDLYGAAAANAAR